MIFFSFVDLVAAVEVEVVLVVAGAVMAVSSNDDDFECGEKKRGRGLSSFGGGWFGVIDQPGGGARGDAGEGSDDGSYCCFRVSSA